MVMLAKGNRSRGGEGCLPQTYGGFYLGSVGGPAARLAQDCIRKVEVLEYPELGMEAVWRIEVENFPAFIVIDDKGNDFLTGSTDAVHRRPSRSPRAERPRRRDHRRPGISACSAWSARSSAPTSRTALKFGGQKINVRPAEADPRRLVHGRGHRARRGRSLLHHRRRAGGRGRSTCRNAACRSCAGPVEKLGALGPMRSVYCRDPDGNLVEIACYARR